MPSIFPLFNFSILYKHNIPNINLENMIEEKVKLTIKLTK